MSDLFSQPISKGEVNPFEDGTDVPRLQKGEGEHLENFAQDTFKILGEAKAKQPTSHNARSLKYFEDQGYLVFKVEGKKATGPGSTVTLDFLGLFDFMAIKVGCPDIGIQVCATSDMAPHLSGMTSTKLTTFNNRAKIDNLKSWIETGHRALILGWAKVGRFYVPTEREITMEYVQKCLARKKRRAA